MQTALPLPASMLFGYVISTAILWVVIFLGVRALALLKHRPVDDPWGWHSLITAAFIAAVFVLIPGLLGYILRFLR